MPQGEEWTFGPIQRRLASRPATTPYERRRRREIRDVGMTQLEFAFRKGTYRDTPAQTIKDLTELRMWHLEKALRANGLWDDDKDGLTGWPGAYGEKTS